MTKLEAIGLAALFFMMFVCGGVLLLGWVESWQRARREWRREWRRRRDRRYAEEVLKRSQLAHWRDRPAPAPASAPARGGGFKRWQRARRERRYAEEVLKRSQLAHWSDEEFRQAKTTGTGLRPDPACPPSATTEKGDNKSGEFQPLSSLPPSHP